MLLLVALPFMIDAGAAISRSDRLSAPPPARTVGATPAMSRCLISKDQAASARLAQSIPGSDDEKAAFADLARSSPQCFEQSGAQMGSDQQLRLGAHIAEALYVRHMARRTQPARPLAAEEQASFDQAIALKTENWSAGAAAGECLVAHDPQAGDRLIRTGQDSNKEAQILDSFVAALPSCLYQGRRLSLNRKDLRFQISRAVYRQTLGSLPAYLWEKRSPYVGVR